MADRTDSELDALLLKADLDRADKLAKIEAARSRKQKEERVALIGLEDKYGPLGVGVDAVFSPNTGEMIAVKRPQALAYENFVRKQLSDRITPDDVTTLVKLCLVYPDISAFERICDEVPDLRFQAANVIVTLGGLGVRDRRPK